MKKPDGGERYMEHSLLEEHILNLEKRLMTYDEKDLKDLLADDFLEFGSSGKTYSKKAILDGTTAHSITFTVTDFSIKWLSPDIVLATYRTFRHNDRKHALRSSIWKLNEGKWQMVFHQGTPATV